MASIVLDSVEPAGVVEYGRAAIGQAHLKYTADGPIVLQLTGRARVQGMWSMGPVSRDAPGWDPLKETLSQFGGVSAAGGSAGVALTSLTDQDVRNIIGAARRATRHLLGVG